MSGSNELDPRLFKEPFRKRKDCNMQIRCYYSINPPPPKFIENMSSCLCPSKEKKCDLGREI